MAKLTQEEKGFLNMAGEFLVAAELNRRHILSAVTYGTSKSADVWAFDASSRRAVRIEVKTTGANSKSWVISNKAIQPANWSEDCLWVFVKLPKPSMEGPPADDAARGRHAPRLFVFTSTEVGKIAGERDRVYREGYLKRTGREFTSGVPKLFLFEAEQHEDRWDKITDRISQA